MFQKLRVARLRKMKVCSTGLTLYETKGFASWTSWRCYSYRFSILLYRKRIISLSESAVVMVLELVQKYKLWTRTLLFVRGTNSKYLISN